MSQHLNTSAAAVLHHHSLPSAGTVLDSGLDMDPTLNYCARSAPAEPEHRTLGGLDVGLISPDKSLDWDAATDAPKRTPQHQTAPSHPLTVLWK